MLKCCLLIYFLNFSTCSLEQKVKFVTTYLLYITGLNQVGQLSNPENNKLVTSVYGNPAFSVVLTNFESFISKCYKRSFIDTLLYRGLVYAPIWKSFIRKLFLWSQPSKAMNYPKNFYSLCKKVFLDKLFVKSKMILTVSKLQLV